MDLDNGRQCSQSDRPEKLSKLTVQSWTAQPYSLRHAGQRQSTAPNPDSPRNTYITLAIPIVDIRVTRVSVRVLVTHCQTLLGSRVSREVLSGGNGWLGDGGPCTGTEGSSAKLMLRRGHTMANTTWQKTKNLKQLNKWIFCVRAWRNAAPRPDGRMEKDSTPDHAGTVRFARHRV